MDNYAYLQLFYCDLFKKSNVGTKQQRKQLIDQILKLKENKVEPAGLSNQNCFRSNYKFGTELDWFRDELRDFVYEICKHYIGLDDSFKSELQKGKQEMDLSMWCNVNEPLSTNDLHSHKGYTFACTYNLQTEGTGFLTFKNPANLLNDCSVQSPFVRDFKIEPKDGDLIVWPAWVPHLVEQNKSNKQRINLAANIKFNKVS